ncbi:MAG: DUF177 domain-containing protein [Cytophagales bacterium]|nr:MAG: DUF177 domain-containing protein [Cytophagales bacterium]
MKNNHTLKHFEIDIVSLKNKEYQFDFSIDEAFFAHFAHPDIKSGKGNVQLKLDKTETMLQLFFTINTQIELICDRCLETFEHPIQLNEYLIIQFGKQYEQADNHLEIIPAGATYISIAQPIYDFISLAIPIKKLHPRFLEEDAKQEGDLLIYSTHPHEDTEKEEDTPPENLAWKEALKKINLQ